MFDEIQVLKGRALQARRQGTAEDSALAAEGEPQSLRAFSNAA